MNFPIILQDINNNILPKEIIVTSPTFFIKSYRKFTIKIQDNFEVDYINNTINKIDDSYIVFDSPTIYSVITKNNIKKSTEFDVLNANYSYTLYLGKSEKTINYVIYFNEEDYTERSFTLTVKYRPNNVLLSNQQHYESLLINNDLPNIDKLLPVIIKKDFEYDLLKKLLLDFKEIKKHRGKLKSIEKFLNFIGFDPDSIKLYPEYNKPDNTVTLNPDKKSDVKNGYYQVLYDNWIDHEDDKYTRKNLPKRILQIKDTSELFDKLIHALILAHNYFTIPEQEMSFFGISNSVNTEQYLSITSNMTQVFYVDTLSNFSDININMYNSTQLDSYPFYIIKDKSQKNKIIKASEVKIYLGSNIKDNDFIFLIDKEISDNYSDTNLSDEEELKIEYLFGNILHIDISNKIKTSDKYVNVEYVVKNLSNEFIQFKSPKYKLDKLVNDKLYIGLYGEYQITFKFHDYFGNQEKYTYKFKLLDNNISFEIFNSSQIVENNNITIDVDSPIFTNSVKANNPVILNTATNMLLNQNLSNYFNLVTSEQFKSLIGDKQYFMKLMNKNIVMKNVTETLPTKYIDNFLNIIAFRKLRDYEYVFSNDLFVIEMDVNVNDIITPYYFISTQTNSVHISKFIYSIDIINSDNLVKHNLPFILDNNLSLEFDYTNTVIPVNFDFELYKELDLTDNTLPYKTINPIPINSVYPRLKNINIDDVNLNDDSYSLKYGDIILCKIDDKYIVNATDIKWQIINAFTGDILFETNNFTLKYRVLESALYNIKLTLQINGEYYVIDRKEIQTSFTL